VERELFDVVAVTASRAVNTGDRIGKRLSLRLIKEAIEQRPSSLHRVFQEVLDLSDDRLRELELLLERTTLNAIISAARVVSNRLDFLRGLEILLFEPRTRRPCSNAHSSIGCWPRRHGYSETSTRSR
jgi:hypothetical protein